MKLSFTWILIPGLLISLQQAEACSPDGKDYAVALLKEQGQRIRKTAERRRGDFEALVAQRGASVIGCAKPGEPVFAYRSTDGKGIIYVQFMK